MGRNCLVIDACGCLVLVAGAAVGGPGNREFSALAKRVSKLEKETAALKKTRASLEKTLSVVRKDAADTGKGLEAVDARSDTRTLLLGEWLDKHHLREGGGRFHREEIARRK